MMRRWVRASPGPWEGSQRLLTQKVGVESDVIPKQYQSIHHNPT